uniref:Endonuclease n=1 Tax=Anopheles atroparvus TaxID=41427 RepID=A0AAG5DMY5_ANOAO
MASSTAFASKKRNNFKCYICGKEGHKRANCLKRKEQHPGKSKETAHVGKECLFIGHSIATIANDSQNNSWFLDSGASDHMIGTVDWLRDVKRLVNPVLIRVASGQILESHFFGNVRVVSKVGDEKINCVIQKVLYVPGLQFNLFSIQRIGQLGMKVIFGKNSAKVLRNGEVVLRGVMNGKLYELDVEVLSVKQPNALVSSNVISNEELWHRRFGHIGKNGLLKIVNSDMVKGMILNKGMLEDHLVCEPCLRGKQTRNPFMKMSLPRSSRPLQLIHSDVCGPITPAAFHGKRYFVFFVDDFTHFAALYTLSNKSEVFEAFKTYAAMAESNFDCRISRLGCDNGGEYIGAAFREFCRVRGIQVEYTVPYTPQQNGVSERFNITVVEKARAMIEDAGMTKKLWSEAVLAAVFIINRSPTAALTMNKTPYEMWYGHKPDVSKFRIFGARAFSFVPKEKRKKFETRSKSCYFVVYGINRVPIMGWSEGFCRSRCENRRIAVIV